MKLIVACSALIITSDARAGLLEDWLARQVDRGAIDAAIEYKAHLVKPEQKLLWKLEGQAGRFRYADDLGDGQYGKITLKGGGFRQLISSPRTIIPRSVNINLRKTF